MTTGDALAAADTCASVVSATCAVLGLLAIRRRRIRRHQALMLVAVAASAVFLALFVFRFVTYGFAEFRGEGALRVVYLVVLFSHEPLAVVSVPLVIVTVVLGLAKSYRAHREIARVALPIWLYSAISGLALYVLLYLV